MIAYCSAWDDPRIGLSRGRPAARGVPERGGANYDRSNSRCCGWLYELPGAPHFHGGRGDRKGVDRAVLSSRRACCPTPAGGNLAPSGCALGAVPLFLCRTPFPTGSLQGIGQCRCRPAAWEHGRSGPRERFPCDRRTVREPRSFRPDSSLVAYRVGGPATHLPNCTGQCRHWGTGPKRWTQPLRR